MKRAIRDRNRRSKTTAHAIHAVNPTGTKAILRFYKAHHGAHADSPEQARKWYASVHTEREAAVIKRDAERKARRKALPLAA